MSQFSTTDPGGASANATGNLPPAQAALPHFSETPLGSGSAKQTSTASAASNTGSRSGNDERAGPLPESEGTIWDGVIAPLMVPADRGSAAPDGRGAGLKTVAVVDSPAE
jgi:hypothetical protein